MRIIERNGDSKLDQKLLILAGWDNDIKTGVDGVVAV